MSETQPYEIDPVEITRGESFRNIYTIRDENEEALDISAATITIYLRLRRGDRTGAPLWDLDGRVAGEGEFVAGGTDGRVRFLREQAETDDLRAGKHWIEILYEDTSKSPNLFRLWGYQRVTVKDPRTGDYV